MATDAADSLCERIKRAQDRDGNLQLLRDAIGRESITGNEANYVELLKTQMDERGLAPQVAEFAAGRPIIWGERKGAGTGRRLQYIGHTDTVHVRGWRERWQDDVRADPFGAAEVDGAIWGRGAADLKGGICAALAALDLLDAADVTLAGDIAFAFIGDEESGEVGSGVSAGIKKWSDMVAAGAIGAPEFAVYLEPTKLDVYTAQIGFFIAEVKVTGKSAYFGKPELGIDALKATHAVLAAVWRHSAALAQSRPHPLLGTGVALVTGITGGGYIAVPGECEFSVIRKLCPGDDLDLAVAAFEDAVRGAELEDGIDIAINYPAGRDHSHGGTPVQIDPGHGDVQALVGAIKAVNGSKGALEGAPYWSEAPFLVNKLACPTVYCAAGDIGNCHTNEERLEVDEYLDAARAFALFNAAFCGVATP